MDDLIKNSKSKDVQYLKIKDIFDVRGGYTPSKRNLDFWSNGKLPWFRMDDIRKNGRILSNSLQKITYKAARDKPFKSNSIILATTATIGEHALIKVPFVANQQFSIFTLKEKNINFINIKYLYYHFFQISEWCKKNTKVSSFPSVDIKKIKEISIPIPSIKEQERIVKILDKFTDLTADLTAELTASIKQYEYYKNFLFSSISNLKLVNLHDLAILSNVGVDKKINDDEKSIKLLNYMDIFLNKHIDSKIPKMVVTASDKKIEVCDVKKGDVFITPSSEKINEIGLTSVVTEDLKNCCYSYHIMRIRLKKENYLLSQYINYYFTSNIAKKQILKKAKGITRYGLTKTNFENIKIFIPSAQQQEIIIKTLDKFESLTSNLREGLPKEIQLQNKQYEYYRNKLLKFEGNN